MDQTVKNDFFKTNIFGHPAGLMVLFFTEMWERFSFYGMRVLLVNFLTMAAVSYNPGWEWSAQNATALFGTYAMLLYITPIVGGIIADKLVGYRWAVVIGSLIMTLGHASMAMDTEFSLYAGLALLVIGTGFFKPNITSIISEIYKEHPEKKDGAYTIFYMGVNAGAFFGMMLCGYLAERIGWSWGFGLAGIFMLLGTLQFWLAKPLFGKVGEVPSKTDLIEETTNINESEEINEEEKLNPFTTLDKILIAISSIIGLGYALNDPLSKIGGIDIFSGIQIGEMEGQYVAVLFALAVFLFLVTSRISRYTKIVRDRMIAFVIFAFFTVFFWLSFEQGATSLVIFARDNVNRLLTGNAATIFNIVNLLLTVVPLIIISWALYLLWKQTYKKIPYSNIVLVLCFLGIWGIAGWMINRDMNSMAYEVSYEAIQTTSIDEETGKPMLNEDGSEVLSYLPITDKLMITSNDKVVMRTTSVTEVIEKNVNDQVFIIKKNNAGTEFGLLNKERLAKARELSKTSEESGIIPATITKIKDNQVEITVSWFSILNSFFIIAFASFFSKWWESKYNPSATGKYALGLIIMAVGFGLLALGSYGVQAGVKVSMVWLILAYLFHTLGELCLSPVGLSYVSKLVPARMIAFMFGMWYLAIAIGNKLAAILGGQIEAVTKDYGLSTFFLIFTIVPAAAGILILFLGPTLKRLMHGVR